MASVTTPLPFADWLRAQLAERGWGVRTLARKIDATNPEAPRRAIYHYLRGSTPTEPYVAAIAEAFGVSRADVPVEEVARAGAPFREEGAHDRDAAVGVGGGTGCSAASISVTEDAA